MSALVIPDGRGELTISGVSMNCPAWQVLDLALLWESPNRRGNNVIIPHAIGRRPFPRRVDETLYSLDLLITGQVDRTGAVYPNPVIGLQANLEYLWANVESPPTPPVATRSAELEMPDGSTREAEVQVQISFDLIGATDVEATLDLTIAQGWFTEVGS